MKDKSFSLSFTLFSLTGYIFPGAIYAASPATTSAVTGCTAETTGANKGKIVPCEATVTIKDIIFKLINWVLGFGAAIAVLFIIYGGFQYLTAAGNEKQAESAKQTLTYAVIGLIVILLAYVIVALVSNTTSAILNTGTTPVTAPTTTPVTATTPLIN